jgi:diadenylate cyclase
VIDELRAGCGKGAPSRAAGLGPAGRPTIGDEHTAARREARESRILVAQAFALVRALGIEKVLVHANAAPDVRAVRREAAGTKIIWIEDRTDRRDDHEFDGDPVIMVPTVRLTRMSQVHMALLLAVMSEHVAVDETVLCLSGIAGSDRLDTMVLANAKRDDPWYQHARATLSRNRLVTRGFARTLEVALRFAAEGREGRPIGTILAVGDVEKITPYVRQLILNPCEGHARRKRSIFGAGFLETLRELAALDGGFVVGDDGVVESAGTYIDAPLAGVELPPGVGARHAAAAALSAATDAVAIVVSESSHAVTVFADGKDILVFEQPRWDTKAYPP